MLLMTRVTLAHVTGKPDTTTVAFVPFEAGVTAPAVTIPRKTWDDMDQPERITVTIEPGDHLYD